jgi:hypothetical protein
MENIIINIINDMAELMEQYQVAASNERLWAKGSPDQETAEMHERNVAECAYLADIYKKISENPMLLVNAIESEAQEEKLYDIWAEGYADNGGCAGAIRLGSAQGKTFKDACKTFAEEEETFRQYFEEEQMTYWGCRLFDNEADARKSFG